MWPAKMPDPWKTPSWMALRCSGESNAPNAERTPGRSCHQATHSRSSGSSLSACGKWPPFSSGKSSCLKRESWSKACSASVW